MDNNFQYNIHESFMARALELSKKGLGLVSPNPLVGCVLVKDGEIIGEKYQPKINRNYYYKKKKYTTRHNYTERKDF